MPVRGTTSFRRKQQYGALSVLAGFCADQGFAVTGSPVLVYFRGKTDFFNTLNRATFNGE